MSIDIERARLPMCEPEGENAFVLGTYDHFHRLLAIHRPRLPYGRTEAFRASCAINESTPRNLDVVQEFAAISLCPTRRKVHDERLLQAVLNSARREMLPADFLGDTDPGVIGRPFTQRIADAVRSASEHSEASGRYP
jgi:hypothetical protein